MADADALPRRRGWAEWALIVLLHAAGLVTIYVTEHGLFAQSLALMTWAFLNLVWIMLTESDGGFNPAQQAIGSGPWLLDA